MRNKKYNFLAVVFLLVSVAGCASSTHGHAGRHGPENKLFLREICEKNNVSWELDNVSQVVTLSYEDRSAKLMVGSPVVIMGGMRTELSVPLKIIRSSVIVPPDFESGVIDALRQKTVVEKLYYVPSAKKVVIDAGHGGKDPGAIGVTKEYEKKIVLDVAVRIRKNLEKKGIKVKMTRATDDFIELEERAKITAREQADLFVSIHANSSPQRAVSGVEVFTLKPLDSSDRKEEQRVANEDIFFRGLKMDRNDDNLKKIVSDILYTYKQDKSRDLAQSIIRKIVSATKTKNLGVKTSRFFVVRNTLVPAVLVEMGFLTNLREEKNLKTPDYRQKLADAISEGIVNYINAQ